MGLESASSINGLVATNPTGSDERRYGDDHIRLLKAVLLATFPGVTGAVAATQADLNALVGWADVAAVTFGTNADHLDVAADPVRVGKLAGMVYLSGTIEQSSNPTTTATTFATLPTGYRPLGNVHALAIVHDVAAGTIAQTNIKISSAGVITINLPGFSSTGPVRMVLSQVRFYFASYN